MHSKKNFADLRFFWKKTLSEVPFWISLLYLIFLNKFWSVVSCWDGLRYMVSITLNNTLFSKISNVHIFRTMHRIVMIFSSKCTLQVTWQMLSTFGTVEYSTGPMRTHKEPTNWTWKFDQKLLGWKHQKLLVGQKNWFFQSPRYRHTNPTTEKETSNQC